MYTERGLPLHLLVNNAGISLVPYATTADGTESNWGVNFVAQVLLTTLLLDVIVKSAPARIVNVGSVTSRGSTLLSCLSPQFYTATNLRCSLLCLPVSPVCVTKAGYSRVRAYGNSKYAFTLYSYELARRLQAAGHTGITCTVADPGVAATEIHRGLPGPIHWLAARILHLLTRTPRQGAQVCVCVPKSVDHVFALTSSGDTESGSCRLRTGA